MSSIPDMEGIHSVDTDDAYAKMYGLVCWGVTFISWSKKLRKPHKLVDGVCGWDVFKEFLQVLLAPWDDPLGGPHELRSP
jgi:hypothetical protein